MADSTNDRCLAEWLVANGKITSEQLQACLEAQQQAGGPASKPLDEILIERGLLLRDDLEATQLSARPNDDGETFTHTVKLKDPDKAGADWAPGPPPQRREPPPSPRPPRPTYEQLSHEVRTALADPTRRIGRYVILDELGRGGMGVVHRCHDIDLHRDVAVKVINSAGQDPQQEMARFKREARAVAKISHPGIVAVHEVNEHDGQPFLVMDYVEGQDFETVLEHDDLSRRRITELVREVALTLAEAHAAGIVHRDVKPQNVMVDHTGHARLLDFGLARDSSARQKLTQTGQLLGTPLYMAPEQISNRNIGPLTDVYALGAMLYRALAGRPPFKTPLPAALFKQILMDDPKAPRALDPSIHRDLETIALRCLEKQPSHRYPSAAEVADELGRHLAGDAITARPIGRTERGVRWARRNPALATALAAFALLAVSASAALTLQSRKAQSERQRLSLEAEQTARDRERVAWEDATRQQVEQQASEALSRLRQVVSSVLDHARSGEHLVDPNDRERAKSELIEHRDPETVRLISAELDLLTETLLEHQTLTAGQELLLSFLCDALWNLGMTDHAVASLGLYLRAELALPAKALNQLRAVPVGRALCLLGGQQAEHLLLEARDGFGDNGPFWQQVQPLFNRTNVVPGLEEETPEGYYRRGDLRQEKGDIDGAITDYSRSLDLDPLNIEAWVNRGLAREAQGDVAGAIADYSSALEIDSSNALAWNNRGSARHESGDLEGAMSDFNRAIKIDDEYATAWSNRGLARQDIRDIAGAIADFTRAIELDPTTRAWGFRGIARSLVGDLDGAIADATRALEIDPSNARLWRDRGNVRFAQGDYAGAIADFSRSLQLAPNDLKTWSNRGMARQASGDLDGAIADYTRAIEIGPQSAHAWNNRGIARRGKGDLAGGIADLTQAIERDPQHLLAWLERGFTRQASGDRSGASADYTHAIDLNPTLAAGWALRGILRLVSGDRQGAIADLTQTLELDEAQPQAWNARAMALLDAGKLDDALADVTRALELQPNDGPILDTRGLVWLAKGEVRMALADLDRAVSLEPDYPELRFNRARARIASGDSAGARDDLVHFLDKAPQNANATTARDLLEKLPQQQASEGAEADK